MVAVARRVRRVNSCAVPAVFRRVRRVTGEIISKGLKNAADQCELIISVFSGMANAFSGPVNRTLSVFNDFCR